MVLVEQERQLTELLEVQVVILYFLVVQQLLLAVVVVAAITAQMVFLVGRGVVRAQVILAALELLDKEMLEELDQQQV